MVCRLHFTSGLSTRRCVVVLKYLSTSTRSSLDRFPPLRNGNCNGKKNPAFFFFSDPLDWTCVHVQKWLLWTEHLYRLTQVNTMFQGLSGRDLCSMTEADFRQRSLQFGDVLYAHLDIWRSGENNRNIMSSGRGNG